MTYQLVLDEAGQSGTKAVGDNVFLANLPVEFPVYAFYYPAEMPDSELEGLLRKLGGRAGNNLFVNIGRLDDPQLDKIARKFEIKSFPSVVVTAIADLAAPQSASVTAYVRLDGRVLSDPHRAITHIENLYLLFLRGSVAEAIKTARWTSKVELARRLGRVIRDGLRRIGSFVADRDLSVSILEGRFELKKSG